MEQSDATSLIQEIGNPEQIKKPNGIGQELSDYDRPKLSVSEKSCPGEVDCRLRRVGKSEPTLRQALFGRTIKNKPKQHPTKTEHASDEKCPPPTIVNCDPGDGQRSYQSADIRAGIEHAGGQGALLLGKPFGHGLNGS